MNKSKRDKIMSHIFDKYTGQEVVECLSIELPNSFNYFYELNVKNSKKLDKVKK